MSMHVFLCDTKVDKLLKKYQGRYAEMFKRLEDKYTRPDARRKVKQYEYAGVLTTTLYLFVLLFILYIMVHGLDRLDSTAEQCNRTEKRGGARERPIQLLRSTLLITDRSFSLMVVFKGYKR